MTVLPNKCKKTAAFGGQKYLKIIKHTKNFRRPMVLVCQKTLIETLQYFNTVLLEIFLKFGTPVPHR